MNNERGKGPQQIGEALGDLDKSLARLKAAHDAQRQKRIEAAARPGESWEQAAARLREEEARAERERSSGSVKSLPPASSIRKPPRGDEQPDFFVPTLYDVGTKDSRSIMDVAVFRLSKKDRRAGEVINYTLPDGHVTVSAGAAGAGRGGTPVTKWRWRMSRSSASHSSGVVLQGRIQVQGRLARRSGKAPISGAITGTPACRQALSV